MKQFLFALLFLLSIKFCGQNGAGAYLSSANKKTEQRDYKGAIEDYTKAIEENSLFVIAYYNRGWCKARLKDDKGAIKDFTKVIELNPKTDRGTYGKAYNGRAYSKYYLGDKTGACLDWKEGAGWGEEDAAEALDKYCM